MRKTLDLAYIGLFAAVIAACALITVPAAVYEQQPDGTVAILPGTVTLVVNGTV